MQIKKAGSCDTVCICNVFEFVSTFAGTAILIKHNSTCALLGFLSEFSSGIYAYIFHESQKFRGIVKVIFTSMLQADQKLVGLKTDLSGSWSVQSKKQHQQQIMFCDVPSLLTNKS